jgi:hypothetical protein
MNVRSCAGSSVRREERGLTPQDPLELPTKLSSSISGRMARMAKGVDCNGTAKFAGNRVLKFNLIRTDVEMI